MRHLVLAALFLLGCEPASRQPTGPGDSNATSGLQRSTTPAPVGDVAAAASSERAFGLALYRDVAAGPGNLFLSPYSVAVALSMTSAGARGTTAQAFDATLGVTLPAPAWHHAMNDLDRQLTQTRTATTTPFRLSTANRQFAQQGFTLEAGFLDTLATEYGADVGLVDFAQHLEPSRGTINGWVDGKTEHRIPELLKPGVVTESTRLVLVNAVYFKAAWATQFSPSATADAAFHPSLAASTTVPFMNATLTARTAQLNGVEVLELPYDGNELSMLVLMPPEGALGAFEAGLTPAVLEQAESALAAEEIDLALPKFELTNALSLAPNLQRLGLGIAFSGQADFSGLSPEPLSIGDVVHQTFVKVDERGTEAAAATAVIMDGGVAWPPPVRRAVALNRPFVFAVVDVATRSLVFIGRVAEP